METSTDNFNLQQTLATIGQAMQAVFSHMLFDFALHGLILALVLAIIGFYFLQNKHPYGLPIIRVSKRLSVFCLVFALPGILYLTIHHCLPNAGVFSFNSIGILCFWAWVSAHLAAEEVNNTIVKKRSELSTK